MLLAIDYDETYTRAPRFWAGFIRMATDCGYGVIIATGRKPEQPVILPHAVKLDVLEVIYCGDEYKRRACERYGHHVDIWIDNEPGTIEPGKKLDWPQRLEGVGT